MNGTRCFFFGLAFGATAGVLMAPRAGVQTRRRIASTAHKSRVYVLRGGAELRDTVAGKLNRTKRAAKAILAG